MFAAPVNGTNPFPGSLMRTLPETTRATTDLPGTGGAGGAAGAGGWGAGAAVGVVLRRIATAPAGAAWETARSGLPSPLKSAAAGKYALGIDIGEPASTAKPPAA